MVNIFQYLLLTIHLEIPLAFMKLPLTVDVFKEMFIPHSGLQSIWDMIGAMLYLFNVRKILIGPNLTYNPRFTIRGVTCSVAYPGILYYLVSIFFVTEATWQFPFTAKKIKKIKSSY